LDDNGDTSAARDGMKNSNTSSSEASVGYYQLEHRTSKPDLKNNFQNGAFAVLGCCAAWWLPTGVLRQDIGPIF
jgi:hypothetical protein